MISWIVGIVGSVILAGIIAFLWVFKSDEDESDVDYTG